MSVPDASEVNSNLTCVEEWKYDESIGMIGEAAPLCETENVCQLTPSRNVPSTVFEIVATWVHPPKAVFA